MWAVLPPPPPLRSTLTVPDAVLDAAPPELSTALKTGPPVPAKKDGRRGALALLDAVVTPSAVYGLTTAPLTAAVLERLAVAQCKMFRLVVGYVKTSDDSWADMHKRLSAKIGRALESFLVRPWKEELAKNKQKLATKIASGCALELVQKIHVWNPTLVVDEKLSVCPFEACRSTTGSLEQPSNLT